MCFLKYRRIKMKVYVYSSSTSMHGDGRGEMISDHEASTPSGKKEKKLRTHFRAYMKKKWKQ